MRLRAHAGVELPGGIARAPARARRPPAASRRSADTGLALAERGVRRASARPIGSAISRPTPNASSTESDSSTAPDQRNSVQASRSGPSTSDSGAQAATRQPVSLEKWKACSERSPSKSVVAMTPSASCLPYCRTRLLGHRLAEELLAMRVRAMLMFLRSATAASQPARQALAAAGSRSAAPARATSPAHIRPPCATRTGTLDREDRALGDGAEEEIRHVGLAGLAARCAAGRARSRSLMGSVAPQWQPRVDELLAAHVDQHDVPGARSAAPPWPARRSCGSRVVASASEVASVSSVVMMPVISRSTSALSARAICRARRSSEACTDCV